MDTDDLKARIAALEKANSDLKKQAEELQAGQLIMRSDIKTVKDNTDILIEWTDNAKIGAKIIVNGSRLISFIAKVVSAILFLVAVYLKWKTGKFPSLSDIGE